MSHKRKAEIATPKDDWGTPQPLFDHLCKEFRFTFDLAAKPATAKCPCYFTPEDNALEQAWHEIKGNLWLNPPYSAGNIEKFMEKCSQESALGARIVALIPNASDTEWYQKYIMGDIEGNGKCNGGAAEVRAIKGRVRFVGFDIEGNLVKNQPTFSSVIAVFDKNHFGAPYYRTQVIPCKVDAVPRCPYEQTCARSTFATCTECDQRYGGAHSG